MLSTTPPTNAVTTSLYKFSTSFSYEELSHHHHVNTSKRNHTTRVGFFLYFCFYTNTFSVYYLVFLVLVIFQSATHDDDDSRWPVGFGMVFLVFSHSKNCDGYKGKNRLLFYLVFRKMMWRFSSNSSEYNFLLYFFFGIIKTKRVVEGRIKDKKKKGFSKIFFLSTTATAVKD